MVFTDTITLYNHYKENGEDKWKRVVLKKVHWESEAIKSVGQGGKVQLAKVANITIPLQEGYVDYINWDFKTDKWTINPENNLDIIVLGDCDKELSDEYRIKDLRRDVSDVMTIASLCDNTKRDYLKHWKVTAR